MQDNLSLDGRREHAAFNTYKGTGYYCHFPITHAEPLHLLGKVNHGDL